MRYHEMPMQTVYAKTLGELIEEDSNVLCLEADLGEGPVTIPEISEKYPDHFIDVGVSEANMISLGAGWPSRAKSLTLAEGNQTKAARWLGLSRLTLREKLKHLGLYPGSSDAISETNG